MAIVISRHFYCYLYGDNRYRYSQYGASGYFAGTRFKSFQRSMDY
ncbi:Uncharacterised protein [Klebsiella quasipneumoniae]|nr:Uncharacterised protein [Klebsiella quasipneumoniae]VGE27218.1 Uncharacterised protein [Klebsiella quasipneumoniae]VGE34267.1 Uncharacterised protein [Klebsiella quasipneumoniae]VGE39485.1 Uncharacterised protein [Klebsiella quasipneumoniae]VGE43225.1 Uncharacterised protein [Klebsiella quasipneumoniae]